jgi:hypothetical protein
MAAAVSATYNLKLIVNETLDLDLDNAPDPTVTHDIGDDRDTLTATSTVKATKPWSKDGALSSGTATIDLTVLPRGNLADATFTGLKVKVFKISCPTGNSAAVVVAPGASNPYDLFGTADDRVSIGAGCAIEMFLADKAETCDASHKTLDLSSDDDDADYSITLVAGGT